MLRNYVRNVMLCYIMLTTTTKLLKKNSWFRSLTSLTI